METKTVSESFRDYLIALNLGITEDNCYISQVPDDAPDTCYWLITAGGSPIQTYPTGGKVKQYFISVYMRSNQAKNIERYLFKLEETINCPTCVELTGYEVLDIETTQFPSDVDLDNEERRVGFLQANIKIYKKEC